MLQGEERRAVRSGTNSQHDGAADHVEDRMADVICPRCGYAPLIIRGGPLTQENIERIKVFCPDCAWPFDRQDIERIVKTHGKR